MLNPPPEALIIHRDQNGYTRRIVGADGVALGGSPRRDAEAPTYLYHGRRYAPFRTAPYRWPRGEERRRFHRHERFPRVFLIPDYFIDNYDDYGLAAPPVNAQWVRQGDDLVLIDLDTGEVLNVVAGAFEESADVPDSAAGDSSPAPDNGPLDIGPPPEGPPSFR